MEIKSIVDQSYWDQGYKNIDPYLAQDQLSKWLYEVYFSRIDSQGLTAFEIGCFPGRYLGHFALNGIQINGIDQTPGIEKMEKWAQSNGYQFGRFYNEDLLSFSPTEKYDLVCSFGFIEHFENFEYIIQKHIEFNKNSGTIVITTPNFAGWGQYLLHRFFDAENLKRHNLKAMDPTKWAKYLISQGYKIDHIGYFGKFDFWFDSPIHGFKAKLRYKFTRIFLPQIKKGVRIDSKALSPFCGILASRISTDVL